MLRVDLSLVQGVFHFFLIFCHRFTFAVDLQLIWCGFAVYLGLVYKDVCLGLALRWKVFFLLLCGWFKVFVEARFKMFLEGWLGDCLSLVSVYFGLVLGDCLGLV